MDNWEKPVANEQNQEGEARWLRSSEWRQRSERTSCYCQIWRTEGNWCYRVAWEVRHVFDFQPKCPETIAHCQQQTQVVTQRTICFLNLQPFEAFCESDQSSAQQQVKQQSQSFQGPEVHQIWWRTEAGEWLGESIEYWLGVSQEYLDSESSKQLEAHFAEHQFQRQKQ